MKRYREDEFRLLISYREHRTESRTFEYLGPRIRTFLWWWGGGGGARIYRQHGDQSNSLQCTTSSTTMVNKVCLLVVGLLAAVSSQDVRSEHTQDVPYTQVLLSLLETSYLNKFSILNNILAFFSRQYGLKNRIRE